ncbi:hypothetical protein AUP68_06710 [Ilyonectria robusta]
MTFSNTKGPRGPRITKTRLYQQTIDTSSLVERGSATEANRELSDSTICVIQLHGRKITPPCWWLVMTNQMHPGDPNPPNYGYSPGITPRTPCAGGRIRSFNRSLVGSASRTLLSAERHGAGPHMCFKQGKCKSGFCNLGLFLMATYIATFSVSNPDLWSQLLDDESSLLIRRGGASWRPTRVAHIG